MIATTINCFVSSYKGLPSAAWKGILVSFLEATLFGVCGFLSLYMVDELHLNVASAGFMMSFYGVGTIIGGLIGGKLSDLISAKIVSIASIFLQSIAFLTLVKASSIHWLAVSLFILGIGSYGFISSNHVWVLAQCRHDENQRLKAINILGVASNLGLGLSALAIGLFSIKNFTHFFIVISYLLLFVAGYVCFIKERNDNDVAVDFGDTVKLDSKLDNKHINIDKSIILFSLTCLFVSGLVITQLSSTYPIYLQSIFTGMGLNSFSILFALNSFIVVLFQAPIVEFFSKNNKILLMGAGAFLLGLGFFLLNFANTYGVAIMACVVMTVGEILFFSVTQLICYDRSSKKGHAIGIYRMVYAVSRMVAPIMGGLIYQKFGGAVVWGVCFVLGLTCLIPSLYLKRFD